MTNALSWSDSVVIEGPPTFFEEAARIVPPMAQQAPAMGPESERSDGPASLGEEQETE